MDPIILPAELDVSGATPLRDTLLERLAAAPPGAALTLDLDGARASQPALQLLAAAHRAAKLAGHEVTAGPHATRYLSVLRDPAGSEQRG